MSEVSDVALETALLPELRLRYGQPVSKLRFRVVDVMTAPPHSAVVADMRLLSPTAVSIGGSGSRLFRLPAQSADALWFVIVTVSIWLTTIGQLRKQEFA